MVETVKFNVGGRHFEVSRALIEQNPDTMLAKMITDTWEKDPDKRLFIDRDGDKFAHVLDYLRYGSIELPPTIPQAMFKRELDYYGILADDLRIKQLSIGALTQKFYAEFNQFNVEFNRQKKIHEVFVLAVECYNQFCANNQGGNSVSFFLNKK
ncbi:hypothetical protein HJC23_006504 [Cyclotella cryptica]|uniref:BTB domain-containing protein n=1 Tax=Cyclotella cryptica TaxID=29204 RepID=A0ABD3PN11_9STRA